ncbi:MAG TPA: family 20 glycosylhydrolase, partial [Blastocatellia bacterium]|nr:family 20 glycosylhydrolase [Blastocatellia bacterium]
SWRGAGSLAEAAVKGYDGILSAGYYIDLLEPAAKHYLADPIPADSKLTEEQQRHVLGGEATMWGEYVGPETIDSRIWPRTAAIAERLWSPASVNDVKDMYRRLDIISVQLEELGLTHKKNEDMMLRRLAGRDDVRDLRQLMDVSAPVTGYARGGLKPSNTLSPLTNIVDIARADPAGARQFDSLVDGFLADAPAYRANRDNISQLLASWIALQSRVHDTAESLPALDDAIALANNLAKAAEAGRDAMTLISSDKAVPAGWADRQKDVLKDASTPKGAVSIAVIPAIQKLVDAASKAGSEKAALR